MAKMRALSVIPGRPFGEHGFGQMVEVEITVVPVGPDPPSLADLDGHRPGNHVPRGKILCRRGVPLHEALALGICQVAAFAPRTLRDEDAGTIDPGRMELHEFHVLERQSRARDHSAAISGAGMGGGRGVVCSPIAAGRENDRLGAERVQGSVIQVPGNDPFASAILRHEEIECEKLDEKLRAVPERLAVERVQDGVSGAVRGGAGALHRRALAEILHVPAERPLVDTPVTGAREGHPVVLELVDCGGSLAAQIFDGILVAEPVRALDGVVHVPAPVVRAHVAQRCRDAALRCDRVRARGEELADAGRLEPCLGAAERGTES